jgi:hypothetical protein
MKHLLNNLTEQEKTAIREQHTGGMKVITENFSKLTNSKLGDSKPLVKEFFDNSDNEPNLVGVGNPSYEKHWKLHLGKLLMTGISNFGRKNVAKRLRDIADTIDGNSESDFSYDDLNGDTF